MATKAIDAPRKTSSGLLTKQRRIRKIFGNIHEISDMPNLIEVQRESYEQFLRSDPATGYVSGLEKTLRSVFPIVDFAGTAHLDFDHYELEHPKYDTDECRQRGLTYAAPMRVTLRLTTFEIDPETEAKSVIDIKEQDVYMGDMPLMTKNGTFIVNGTERVIVSQMHRSPGVLFDHDRGKTHASGKFLFAARVIPYRGSWLDFEFDAKDIVNVRIDRKRKLPVTALLHALGMSSEDILNTFYNRISYVRGKNGWQIPYSAEAWRGQKPMHEVVDADSGEIIFKLGEKITPRRANQAGKDGVKNVLIPTEEIFGRYSAYDLINEKTGEIYIEAGDEVSPENMEKLDEAGIDRLELLDIDYVNTGPWMRNTLKADKSEDQDHALSDIYRVMRPGEPPTRETADALFYGLFFDPERYDLSAVGRVKLNMRLGLDAEDTVTTLRREDILAVVQELVNLKDGKGEIDDIDNLANRRVRSVGELLENQYRVGLLRMERAVKERMSSVDVSTVMPNDLINAKPAVAAVREFFGSSQLSQFMDQTNPLSEVTHKRRVSALGPGGLTRERAGFEVRDVHPTHYGRICPIETPEGPNIGLISSLSCFARINEFGFIESPYRKVKDGKVLDFVEVVEAGDSDLTVGDKIQREDFDRVKTGLQSRKKRAPEAEPYCFYLSAWEEDKYTIAQANIKLDDKGNILEDRVSARKTGNFILAKREEVDYLDVSPKQLVSVAASLVPFLENDDANRALMGSNMQRQAVPLLRSEAPLVGTGMEHITVKDSGAAVVCRRAGVVDSVDSRRIIVRVEAQEGPDKGKEIGADIYNLTKFKCSNQNTSINQKPIVKVGQHVAKGQILADGPCTDMGELALGRNVLVAFMPWRGYNFEDAILVSERLVKDDMYTSIHIEEFEIEARDTKLGPEEVTRDIPNVSESLLNNLDESGIIRIGASVKPGDILVGKVTPKGETQLTPEEKLLRAIFGEKAGDVRDASLVCPPGIEGIIVGVKIFSRKGIEKDDRAKAIEATQIAKLEKNLSDEIRILTDERLKRLENILGSKEVLADLHDERTNKRLLTKDTILDRDTIERISTRNLKRIKYADKDPRVNEQIDEIEEMTSRQIDVLKKIVNEKKDKLTKGDELPPGVIKLVKVYIAMKRKLSVGDKMAGRHGNKGVIARILQEEDMPYLEDGTAVEIVLNPLGVPSRMNVGQILETHLGWAGHELGGKIAELLKENSKEEVIRRELKALFKDTTLADAISELDDEELAALAPTLTRGVFTGSPVFDGSKESEIKALLRSSGLPESGKTYLYDGMTGEKFEQPVTVG